MPTPPPDKLPPDKPLHVKQLDHVALHVQDLEQSIAFYRELLCLPPLSRPAFDFEGAWFRLGGAQELHLIADRRLPVHSHSRGTHFALAVADIDAWDHHLSHEHLERSELRIRPDGARQLFVRDPDGHWIELVQAPS